MMVILLSHSSQKRGSPRWPYFNVYFYHCSRSIILFCSKQWRHQRSQYFWYFFCIHSLCRRYMAFSLKKESIETFVETFALFSSFLGLKHNSFKSEICGLGHLRRVEMAVCGMQSVNVTRDAIKVLVFYFSYKMSLMNEKNYCQTITNIYGILKLRRIRNTSIDGKI